MARDAGLMDAASFLESAARLAALWDASATACCVARYEQLEAEPITAAVQWIVALVGVTLLCCGALRVCRGGATGRVRD